MPKHYHVGSNTPGYLPDSDLTCHLTISDTVAGLRAELTFWAEDENDRIDEVENAANLAQALEDRTSEPHRQEVATVERNGGAEYRFTGELGDRVFFIAVVDGVEPCPDQEG